MNITKYYDSIDHHILMNKKKLKTRYTIHLEGANSGIQKDYRKKLDFQK